MLLAFAVVADEFRRHGGVRIWAGPETQGEAYIPFAMDRRDRAEGILAGVAQRFGGEFAPNTGTALAATAAGSGGSTAAAVRRLEILEQAVLSSAEQNAQSIGAAYHAAVDKQVRRQGLTDSNRPR